MTSNAVKLSAKEVSGDIRQGLDDASVMQKYGLSERQLQTLLQKLLEKNLIKQSDLKNRGTMRRGKEPNANSGLPATAKRQSSRTNDSQNQPKDPQEIRSFLAYSILGTIWLVLAGGCTLIPILGAIGLVLICIILIPIGVNAVLHSTRARSRCASGDIESARFSSQAARKWVWISFVAGLALPILLVGGLVILASMSPVAAPFIYTLF